MTLREMLDFVGIDENPLQCAFVIAGLLRTSIQREVSTFEGECATLLLATEHYGKISNPENLRRWIDDLGQVMDIDVPDSLWFAISEADKDEQEICNE